jgi:hypothetical protein
LEEIWIILAKLENLVNENQENFLSVKPSCHAFGGVTPPNMKIELGKGKLKSYFRIKPPCPAFWGVAPRGMKIDRGNEKPQILFSY